MILLNYLKCGFGSVLILFVLLHIFIYTILNGNIWNFLREIDFAKSEKIILIWTGTFGSEAKLSNWWVSETSIKNICPFSCKYSVEKSEIEKAQAVIFHGLQIDIIRHPKPTYRTNEQIWIFNLLESPQNWEINSESLKNAQHFYNWTATYRSDSDIHVPYGEFKLRNKILSRSIIRHRNKTKLIAWMVSKCKTSSNREAIVQELEKFVKIDKFGKCNGKTCFQNRIECFRNLSQKFKFYLSFENSLCEDYVTEKFFTPLKYGMVPIVYGGANYSKIAPPKSYINVEDFESIESLGKYLLYLDQNHGEYEKYFEWTKTHTVESLGNSKGFCTICKKLHENYEKSKFYENLQKWWTSSHYSSESTSCHLSNTKFSQSNDSNMETK